MSKEIENIRRLIENKGMQFRDFRIGSIETRAAEAGEPEKLIIRGVPAVFDSETLLFKFRNWNNQEVEIYEKIDRDAFDEADMSDVIFNMNHGGRVFARTRNNSLILGINKEVGLKMETELWDDDEGHRQLYRDIKRGNIDKMSYAYRASKVDLFKEEDEDGGTIRMHYTVRKIERVFDVSAVDIPAYDATEISARKRIEAESYDLMSARLQAVVRAAESAPAAAGPAESGQAERNEAFEREKELLLTRIGGNR